MRIMLVWGLVLLAAECAADCTPGAVNPADYDYPPGFPPAPDKAVLMFRVGGQSIGNAVLEYETPIAIRIFSMFESISWNCIAAYDPVKHGSFDLTRRPIISTIPAELEGIALHSTPPRALCMAHAYAAAISVLVPEAEGAFRGGYSQLGFTDFLFGIHQDVEACGTHANPEECLNEVVRCHNYKPEVVASAIVWEMREFAVRDGWNSDGLDDGCEANCRPYSDTTGYTPVNIPGHRRFKERWQPLLEDDGKGFFYRQEHVTPHVGTRAVTRVLSRADLRRRVLPRPRYNYRKEAKLVLQRLAGLTDQQKMEIEFFDNKVNVVTLVGIGLRIKYGDVHSFERVILFTTTYLMSEYDTTIVAWKEKVRHDRVRPTTVIQQSKRYGTDKKITTWAGPGQGTKTFESKYFQPYIRVMPHSEYPSGSGCICQGAMEVTTGYMKRVYNDTSGALPMRWLFRAGSSSVEPGVTPAQDVFVSYPSLEAMRNTCGQSRLDGGMHFTAAVTDSYELCKGIGSKAAAAIDALLNGSEI